MKKFLILIIMLLSVSYSNVFAVNASDLVKLNLSKEKSYNLENNYKTVQGGTVTDKYIVFAEINGDNNKTVLKVVKRSNFKEVKVVTDYNFGHANDMTYNSETNKIIVAAGSKIKKLYILDADTFKLDKTVSTSRGYSSIAYDKKNNQYIARLGQYAYILNLNFKEIDKFKMSSENLTTQGIGVLDGKIYYTCYEAGKVTSDQSVYDGVLKKDENVIFIYDIATHKKQKVYYIPQKTKENVYPGEVEGIDFIGNKPVIWSNNNGKINLFMPIIKELNTSLNFSLQDSNLKIKDNELVLNLYEGDNLIAKTKSSNNKFIFNNLKFEDEATINYKLKISNDNYKLNTKNVSVKVNYDFYKNKLVVNYNNLLSLSKIETKGNNKQEETKPKEEEKEETKKEETKSKEEVKEETKKEETKSKEEVKEETKKEETKPKEEEKEETKKEETKPKEEEKEETKKEETKPEEEVKEETKKEETKAKEEVKEETKSEDSTLDNKDSNIIDESNNDESLGQTVLGTFGENMQEEKLTELVEESSKMEIEVPDTATKSYSYIIGIIFILISIVMIKFRKFD